LSVPPYHACERLFLLALSSELIFFTLFPLLLALPYFAAMMTFSR
jgi:hypothetical protein